jgi:ATP-dependent DNA helicase HFM1/MER3
VKFKQNERPVFRELNKSPFILHPIRESPNKPWHKVFLIIQIVLGGVELPNDKDSHSIRLQFSTTKKMVLETMQRLARCFVDCRGAENNAIGTKLGLELSRALAAGCWEGRPTQLLQVPGIGPVGMRKLVSQDVRTVSQLADLDYMNIERLLSRNPPFGKKTEDILQGFPRLSLDISVMKHNRGRDAAVADSAVTVQATLSFSNHSLPMWTSKTPWLTFMAETADGTLAYFWRGSLKKLNKNKSLELQFPVNVDGSAEVYCHFSCEEIVGTIVSRTLKLDKSQPQVAPNRPRETLNDDFHLIELLGN